MSEQLTLIDANLSGLLPSSIHYYDVFCTHFFSILGIFHRVVGQTSPSTASHICYSNLHIFYYYKLPYRCRRAARCYHLSRSYSLLANWLCCSAGHFCWLHFHLQTGHRRMKLRWTKNIINKKARFYTANWQTWFEFSTFFLTFSGTSIVT